MRQPLLSGLAILSLTIGIALVTLMFSVLQGIFLRQPAHTDLSDIYRISWQNASEKISSMPVASTTLLEWREKAGSLEHIEAFLGTNAILVDDGETATRSNAAYVTSDLFSLVGATPIVGRGFHHEESIPGQDAVVVLSYDLWQERYRGAPDIVGRTLKVNDQTREVIGVMPEGFRFPLNQYLWMPLTLSSDPKSLHRSLQVLAKPLPNVRPDQVEAQLASIDLPSFTPNIEVKRSGRPVLATFKEAYTDADLRSYLEVMLLASFIVLLIAGANVAGLLLVRSVSRAPELAMRRALGAGGRHIFAIPMTEAVLLSTIAGGLGVVLASAGSAHIHELIKPHLKSYWIEVAVDPPVFGVTLATAFLLSLLVSGIPALRALRLSSSFGESVRGAVSSRSEGALLRSMVVAQIALTFGLLIPTGLVLTSLVGLGRTGLGIDTENILTAKISLPARYDSELNASFIREMEAQFEELPEVQEVAFSTYMPGQSFWQAGIEVEGAERVQSEPFIETSWSTVTPGFFEIFGLSPSVGRFFNETDRDQEVIPAVVTEAFAERYFSRSESMVGRRIRFEGAKGWLQVIGVVPNTAADPGMPKRARGRLAVIQRDETREKAAFFLPLSKVPNRWLDLVVKPRASGVDEALTAGLRRVLAQRDSQLPLFWVEPMQQRVDKLLWDYRLFGGLFVIFGLVALVQTLMGLFAAIQLGVTRRLREMGLRMALGAQPRAIFQQVLGECCRWLFMGLLMGSLVAFALARSLQSMIYGASSWSWGLYLAAILALVLTGLAAAWLPAYRASAVDPAVVLRAE